MVRNVALFIPIAIFIPLALWLTAACSPAPNESATASGPATLREPQRYISEAYAKYRKQRVEDVHYHFAIDITNREYFTGTASIDFTLKKAGAPITLDFDAGNISRLEINGRPATVDYEKWFITLDRNYLTEGKNHVAITYKREYTNDGAGLYQYRDPETENHYLYTQFEPYEANKFAPMFDQPNIKATFAATVTAPEQWQVISATRESEIKTLDSGMKQWVFPASKIIPSYVYSLHAGPFAVWQDSSGKIPLRLFARQEMAKFVKPEQWFSITHNAFDFFNAYYEFPYPFQKYDQLIVPNFNFGAMENLAAVTFSETRFVHRGEATAHEKFYLAEVIAHELAHQWFGNIVTMDWWSGLWLNESFATLMSFLAVEANPDFSNVWGEFLKLKNWAYYEDQLVTTHPIDVPVAHPGEAFTLIDGISYGKGASVLKQLRHFVGEQKFQQAIASYISKHQYANTELNDFVAAMAAVTQSDMSIWAQQWLYEPGVNTIEPKFDCDNGQLTALSLQQIAPTDWPTLRSQKVQLGLFQKHPQNGMTLTATLPASYHGETTDIPLTGHVPCPDFIHANYDNWGFVKLRFDERSLQTLVNNIAAFDNAQMRASLWQSLWHMVDDLQFSLQDYVQMVDTHIGKETDETTTSAVLANLALAFDDIEAMPPEPLFENTLQQIEALSWREFYRTRNTGAMQKVWFKAAISHSHSDSKLAELATMLTTKTNDPLLQDQDLRWLMVQQLNRYSFASAQPLLEAEIKRDTSERGRQSALVAQAIRPQKATKQEWIDELLRDNTQIKLSDFRAVLRRLFPGKQRTLQQEFGDQLVSALVPLSNQKPAIFLDKLAELIVPLPCSPENIQPLDKALETEGINASLVKALKINRQYAQRCIAKRDLMLSN